MCYSRFVVHSCVILASCMAASRYLDREGKKTVAEECGKPSAAVWDICSSSDKTVTPAHLVDPFLIAFCALTLMNLPSICLTHTHRLETIKTVSAMALVLLGGAGIAQYTAEHVSKLTAYVGVIHGTTLWLYMQQSTDRQACLSSAGECLYGFFNSLGIVCLLVYAVYIGPPVVVTPNHPGGLSETCGTMSHLLGVICTEPMVRCMNHVAKGVLGVHRD